MSIRRRGRGLATVVAVGMAAAMSVAAAPGNGNITTVDLTTLTPTDLAEALVGTGVTVSNAAFTGPDVAGGTFSTTDLTIFGFGSGIVLSSGDIADIVGPNEQSGVTTSHGTAGDADLETLVPQTTFDASVLTFDFVPDDDTVFFTYVFASDEYNEFVNTPFNDVFGFFVNGTNCAVVGSGDPVSINSINNGPLNDGVNATNPSLYRNNDLNQGGGSIDTEMDGLTKVLTCTAAVNPGVTNTMKLAIADAGDSILDSNVMIQAGSLSTTPPEVCDNGIDDDGDGLVDGDDPDCEGAEPPVDESLAGSKYYDSNTNGQRDAGEPGIAGWVVDVASDGGTYSAITDEDGGYAVDVAPGIYTVAEQQSAGPWVQTGNDVDESGGTAGVTLEDHVYTVEVGDGQTAEGLDHGNVCLGGSDARSKGWWTNRHGKAAFDADSLALVNDLHLRNEDGSDADFSDYGDFRSFLRKARSVNAANMLSAQLAALALNAGEGFVDAGDYVWAPEADSANANGFATVADLIAEADAELLLHADTTEGGIDAARRAYQLALSDALDAANTADVYVQQPEDCPAPSFAFAFSETWDAENSGNGVLNHASFAQWEVSDGTVDLIGNGFFDFYPGSGLYVDLDGSTGDAGLLETKDAFALLPGTYDLTFELGGSTRGSTETVTVSLGTVYSEDFTLLSGDPLTQITRQITVTTGETASLSFQNGGGDNVGLILDDVTLGTG